MKKLLILLLITFLFSSCDSIYYKGQFYKPLYAKAFILKIDTSKRKNMPEQRVDSFNYVVHNDSLPKIIEMPIDSIEARINRHAIKYNNKYIYTREELGIKAQPAKNNKVLGYVVDDKNKELKKTYAVVLIGYAVLSAITSIIAAIVLFLLIFGIDNN